MLFNPRGRIVSTAVVIATFTAPAGAWPHERGQKAQVRFLATGTLIRSTWTWNEDTYLAELTLTASAEPLLVRLIDSYPNEAPPLSRAVLTSSTGTALHVRRDTECDSSYGQMILRAAPGDPMAILHKKLGFQPHLTRTPAPDELLPCYRTVRR